LISPVYCSNGTTCQLSPGQQTDIDMALEASFGIDSKLKDFKGALLYKLRKKYATENYNTLDSDTVSIEDTAVSMYLLVIWDVKDEWDNFCICLIECLADFAWDEDKLWALRNQHNDQFYKEYNYRRTTWLTQDGTMMETKRKVTYGSVYKLDIVISGKTGADSIKRPMKIDPKRLVLSLSMADYTHLSN
jgi:hypothetical protein